MMAAKAAEGRSEGKTPPIKGSTPQICGVNDKGNSPAKASDAAKAMGISTRSVESAIKVRRDAAEEVADAVDSGEITLNAASQLAKNVPDKEEQKKAVRRHGAHGRRACRLGCNMCVTRFGRIRLSRLGCESRR